MKIYQDAIQIGDMSNAMLALTMGLRFRLLGGHNLALVLQSSQDQLKFVVSEYNLDYIQHNIMLSSFASPYLLFFLG